MCNLYQQMRSHDEVRAFARFIRGGSNLPPAPGIYPDHAAPIIRTGSDGVRELVTARWGMPSPAFALQGRTVDRGVTNIRNTASPHWRRWLGVAHRCLVPFTAFAEPGRGADGRSAPVWFALDETQPLACFAGLWTRWTSTRKKAEGEVTLDLFAFLTTTPNDVVGAIHPKAMPVILTEPAELEAWLTAPSAEALRLQRPLPDGALRIVTPAGEAAAPPAGRLL